MRDYPYLYNDVLCQDTASVIALREAMMHTGSKDIAPAVVQPAIGLKGVELLVHKAHMAVAAKDTDRNEHETRAAIVHAIQNTTEPIPGREILKRVGLKKANVNFISRTLFWIENRMNDDESLEDFVIRERVWLKETKSNLMHYAPKPGIERLYEVIADNSDGGFTHSTT